MKKSKTLLTLALCLALLLSCGAAACAQAPAAAGVKTGDVLCFGRPEESCGFLGRWLVLDAEHTNTGGEGMFLVSLDLIGSAEGGPLLFRDIGEVSVSFSDTGRDYAAAHPGVTDYRDSDIRRWCGDFAEEYLSAAEREALIPTDKSDTAIVIPGLGIALPGAPGGTVDFDPAPAVLDGDRLFLLSVEEIMNESYGFVDACSRVALFRGEAAGYWLRSPHIPTFPLDVGFVFHFGAVMDYPVNARSMYEMTSYARPACNLDPAKISSLELLAETDGVAVWRAGFGGEENTRGYDLNLPVVGEVMDLSRTITAFLIAALVLLAAVLALIVWLIVRGIRKRRARRAAG